MCDDICYFSELELYFGSAAAAAAAAESLHKMRDGIEVDYGQPLPLAENNAAGKCWGCLVITIHLMLGWLPTGIA